jgi:hypothetical protein
LFAGVRSVDPERSDRLPLRGNILVPDVQPRGRMVRTFPVRRLSKLADAVLDCLIQYLPTG